MNATHRIPAASDSAGAPLHDDLPTIAAIAVIAFIIADVGHEVIGHGIGFLVAGGRAGIFTTTRLIAHQSFTNERWRIFDLGGPFGNLFFAGAAWLSQRLLRRPAERLRLLLWLVTAFSLFWGLGYLIYCGVTGRGDWLALVPGARPGWFWRIALVAVGVLLYRATMLVAASELHWIVASRAQWPFRVRRIAFVSYLAGGMISCAGAILDPRGAIEILNSGATSGFLAALGLLWMPQLFGRMQDTPIHLASAIDRSAVWILVATFIAVLYIAILGPGVKVTF